VVLCLSQDGACTDSFENFRDNSLKGGLSNDITLNLPLFSLVNTFKEHFFENVVQLCLSFFHYRGDIFAFPHFEGERIFFERCVFCVSLKRIFNSPKLHATGTLFSIFLKVKVREMNSTIP